MIQLQAFATIINFLRGEIYFALYQESNFPEIDISEEDLELMYLCS